MKVYVLVAKDEKGGTTFNMPVTFGRGLRAYNSEARAKVYARKFKCSVVELKTEEGKIVYETLQP
jgi:hypothetical protein